MGELSGEHIVYDPVADEDVHIDYKIGVNDEQIDNEERYYTGLHLQSGNLFFGHRFRKKQYAPGYYAVFKENLIQAPNEITVRSYGEPGEGGNVLLQTDYCNLAVSDYDKNVTIEIINEHDIQSIFFFTDRGEIITRYDGGENNKVLTYSFPQSVYIEDGGGMDLNNSDILGANGIFFRDEANSAREGIFFPKQGMSGSTDYADYHRLYVYRGKLYLDGREIAFV